jgi:hypothetical protein
MSMLRIMSHNQWKCDDNKPAWEEKGMDCSVTTRTRGFVKVFADTRPDMIGCQETSFAMADKLIRYCAEDGQTYALLWGRDTPIFYRQDKFELVDSAFSLYPNAVPGFDGVFNNSQTKSWNIGVFRIKENGNLFIFCSTHLWWKSSNPASHYYQAGSDEARAYQIGLAIEQITRFQEKYNCPAILVGDLNANYASQAVQKAFELGFVHAHDIATDYADETNGHHDCGNNGYGNYRNTPFATGIDHILLRGAPEGSVKRFDRFQPEYYLPLSDHSPVYIDIEL